jgi:glycosyltransferase involved in cell wall biosynthesis
LTVAAGEPSARKRAGRSPRVSVVMPTWGHEAFVRRALDSLAAQTLEDWELIVVDDASPDATWRIVEEGAVRDDRFRLVRLGHNLGLGAALNHGLDAARAPLVAYLPSDDVLHAEHLETLVALLDATPDAVAAYSGIRYHYNRYSDAAPPGEPLQLVQVVHRRGPERWLERAELVTDDLDRMLWGRLRERGNFVGSGRVSCEWVSHPDQLNKILREPEGGIATYRDRFGVTEPLRFHTTVGNRIDEWERYRRFRERPLPSPATDGLRILLVGELAYNPERILALTERGHSLFGLWMPRPYWYNTVGPLPFQGVEDVPREGWQSHVRRIRPDVVYAGLNWQAVPWAHHVLSELPDVPFVWHFKEGPFICLEKGTWPQLVDLTLRSDGQVYTSQEHRDWMGTVVPGAESRPTLVLDGDLPKREWLEGPRAEHRLSDVDGELHTVVPGRPIGLHPEDVGTLGDQRIHLHFYGDWIHGQWRAWIDRASGLAPGRLHLHPNVDQADWVSEFSKYDAGWLHRFRSRNKGDLRRADWDDLNVPARMATLAAAGLPMLQGENVGHVVATQRIARDMNLGYLINDLESFGTTLRDDQRRATVSNSVWQQRDEFTFDAHADRLVEFLRAVAARGADRAASPRHVPVPTTA